MEGDEIVKIAIIAHDKKKYEMVAFAYSHRGLLSQFELVAYRYYRQADQ